MERFLHYGDFMNDEEEKVGFILLTYYFLRRFFRFFYFRTYFPHKGSVNYMIKLAKRNGSKEVIVPSGKYTETLELKDFKNNEH